MDEDRDRRRADGLDGVDSAEGGEGFEGVENERLVGVLRRYRPVAPPVALRERCLAPEPIPRAPEPQRVPEPQPAPERQRASESDLLPSRVARRRTWPWIAAAAALLMCALALQVASSALLARARDSVPASPGPAAVAVASLAGALGGDDAAWQAATLAMGEQLARAEQERERRDVGNQPRTDSMLDETGEMP